MPVDKLTSSDGNTTAIFFFNPRANSILIRYILIHSRKNLLLYDMTDDDLPFHFYSGISDFGSAWSLLSREPSSSITIFAFNPQLHH